MKIKTLNKIKYMSTEIAAPAKNGASRIPTLDQLITETDLTIKENNLTVLLNQQPPDKWLKHHPIAKIKNAEGKEVPLPFLPIDRIEYLLTRIFGKWWVEIKDVKVLANSVSVTVRLFVINPITRATEWQDGIGAAPIQTNKGAGAMDWNEAKSTGVQIAAPAAESYAIKDAAEKWGKLFGKDLGRKDNIGYDSLLKEKIEYDWEMLAQLFELKKAAYPTEDLPHAERIIKEQEKTSYTKLLKQLQSL